MEAIPETTGHIREVQQQQNSLAAENEENDLSESESRVLQVQLEQKGETVSKSKNPKESSQNHSVRGRLKQHIKFWERIEAPDFILSTIADGYKIPLKAVPPYTVKKNNKSAYLYSQFVTEAIEELLEGNRISEVGRRE